MKKTKSFYFYLSPIIRILCLFCLYSFSHCYSLNSVNVNLLGHTGGEYYDVAIQGNYAYIAEGAGLSIQDISNPNSPQLVGVVALPSIANAVKVNGNYAYVADGSSGLQIIDVSNPANPTITGYVNTPDVANGLAVSGNYVYVAANGAGLCIFDVSNPNQPVEVGNFSNIYPFSSFAPIPTEIYSDAYGVVVKGNYAYLLTWFYESSVDGVYEVGIIYILDVTDPTKPYQSGITNTPYFAIAGTIEGDYLYALDLYGAIDIFDISNPYEASQVGNVNLPVGEFDIVAKDSIAYVAGGSSGLRIANIDTTTLIHKLSEYVVPDSIINFKINGNYAYLADGTSGLHILNITNPNSPVEMGHCNTPGVANSVALQGNYAFIADESSGLRIINISSPSNPYEIAFLATPDVAYDVAVNSTFAYVADGNAGLRVIDISNISNPVEVSSYTAINAAYGLALKDNFVYLGGGNSGLVVIDISNPVLPNKLSSYAYDPYENTSGVSIYENFAFIRDSYYGGLFQIIDISNPTTLTLVTSSDLYDATEASVQGNFIFCTGAFGLEAYDISSGILNPVLVGYYGEPYSINGVEVIGNYAYVGNIYGEFQVFDISTMALPYEITHYITTGSPTGVDVKGNDVYVASGLGGLRTIDVSTISTPFEVSHYTNPDAIRDIVVNGNYLNLADSNSGLWDINISNVNNPTIAGSYFPPEGIYGVAVNGNYAYLADQTSGIQIVDISNPNNPTEISNVTTSWFVYKISINGNNLYAIPNNTYILGIWDISTPSSPAFLGSYTNSSSGLLGMAVSGHYVYLGDGTNGFRIVDVSDPQNPIEVGYCNTPGEATRIAVSGNYAYVADWGSGLQVIDISSAASPHVAGSYLTQGYAYDIAVSGNNAYVSSQDYGLFVIDISDPKNPIEIGNFPTPAIPLAVAANGNIVYLGTDVGGLWIFQVTPISPKFSQIPYLKLFTNQSVTHAFDLDDYNTGSLATTYSILTNFLFLGSLDNNSVNQGAYGSATVGTNTFVISNSMGTTTASNEVKYSTFKIYKLPQVGLTLGSSWDLNISGYTSSSTGLAIPPSFGNTDSLNVSDTTLVSATWLGNTVIRLTSLQSFYGAVNVDVIASTNSNSPFGIDMDKERIQVYTNRLANSTFTTSNDTSIWMPLELAPGRTTLATQNWISSYTDSAGNQANGVWQFTFADVNGGVKSTPVTSNWITIVNGQWYTFRIRLVADTPNNSHQSLLFGYTNYPGTGTQTDIVGNVLFGVPTVWTWQEAPLLAHGSSALGYPQFQFKAGGAGSIYVDEIQIINATPALMQARSNTHSHYLYGQFTTGNDTMGWGQELYPGSVSAPSITVNNGLVLNFAGAGVGTTAQEGIKWTANNGVLGVYSFPDKVNHQVGTQLTLSIVSGNFNTLGIVLVAAYGTATAGDQDIDNLIAAAGVGTLVSGNYYAIGDALYPYIQGQFGLRSDASGILEVNNVDVNVDNDDPNFGDPTLFP